MRKVEVIELRTLARLLGLSDERVRQVVRGEVDDAKKITPQFDFFIGSRAVRVVSWEAARERWLGKKKVLNPYQERYLDELRSLSIVTGITYQDGHEKPEELEVQVLGAAVFPARDVSGAE